MVKNHLKRLAAPKKWPVKRKASVFILKPEQGPHNLQDSQTLNFALIDILKIAKTRRESRYILNNREILVNGKRRKSEAFPFGLFDVISIKDTKENYRVVFNKNGKLSLIEIGEKEATLKPCKITGKTIVRGKTQLNFADGSNLIVEKDDYKTGDTIILDIMTKTIEDHLRLEKGNTIVLTAGKNTGTVGAVEDVAGSKILYRVKANEIYETLKNYAFVVGREKSVIKLSKE